MDVDSLAHNVARRSNVPESSSEQSLTARSPDGAACAGEPCMEGSVGCFAFKLDGGMPHVPQNKSCEQQRVSQHAEKRALTPPGKEASGKDKEDERPSFTGNGIRPRAASFDAKTMEIDELGSSDEYANSEAKGGSEPLDFSGGSNGSIFKLSFDTVGSYGGCPSHSPGGHSPASIRLASLPGEVPPQGGRWPVPRADTGAPAAHPAAQPTEALSPLNPGHCPCGNGGGGASAASAGAPRHSSRDRLQAGRCLASAGLTVKVRPSGGVPNPQGVHPQGVSMMSIGSSELSSSSRGSKDTEGGCAAPGGSEGGGGSGGLARCGSHASMASNCSNSSPPSEASNASTNSSPRATRFDPKVDRLQDLLDDPKAINQFTDVKCLGRGSFGQAMLMRSPTGYLLVAKKLHLDGASAADMRRLETEVAICAKLRHPNICHYIGTGARDGLLMICLEYASGGTLSDRIDRALAANSHFPVGTVTSWIAQIATAVDYMHSKRVLHRDLSAPNVFLSGHDDIKVGDFGLSKSTGNSVTVRGKTICGTPNYFSPEMVNGEPYGVASDVWSVGLLAHEIITLRHPFLGGSFAALLRRIMACDYDKQRLAESPYPDEIKRVASDQESHGSSVEKSAAVRFQASAHEPAANASLGARRAPRRGSHRSRRRRGWRSRPRRRSSSCAARWVAHSPSTDYARRTTSPRSLRRWRPRWACRASACGSASMASASSPARRSQRAG